MDGKTAIVTGAGGNPSLGRAHALLLAARGANVVVNDIAKSSDARGLQGSFAETVVKEIRALGGKAVADTNSVASQAGAEEIVRTAIEAFGGLDILVNNAGMAVPAGFDEITPHDFDRHHEVNFMGTVWMCRAAWPIMKAKRYGRIVNTTSSSFAGFKLYSAYGSSKGAVFSLTRNLAVEGEPFGIKANSINPGAFTRLVKATLEEGSATAEAAKENLPAELVSPVVAYLAHEDCPVTGECFDAAGGAVWRTYLTQSRGFSDRSLTPEMVASRWAEVMSEEGATTIGLGESDLSASTKPYVRPPNAR